MVPLSLGSTHQEKRAQTMFFQRRTSGEGLVDDTPDTSVYHTFQGTRETETVELSCVILLLKHVDLPSLGMLQYNIRLSFSQKKK